MPFQLSHSALFSADNVYLDIQNSAFPTGEIRGQVLDDYVAYTLATDSADPSLDFIVYPNPSTGKITIATSEFKNAKTKIEVFDLLGRTAFSKEYPSVGSSELKIDLGALSKGNYLLKVSNDNQFTTKKITLN